MTHRHFFLRDLIMVIIFGVQVTLALTEGLLLDLSLAITERSLRPFYTTCVRTGRKNGATTRQKKP